LLPVFFAVNVAGSGELVYAQIQFRLKEGRLSLLSIRENLLSLLDLLRLLCTLLHHLLRAFFRLKNGDMFKTFTRLLAK
jgi:hypothetical protein